MRKTLLALVAAVWLCLLCPGARAQGLSRALLVGCDHFVTQEDTGTASATNVSRMAEALSGGSMNLEELVTRRGDVNSVAELESLIHTAFADADAGDVNYFYISTHGQWSPGTPSEEMTLLLSDGNREEGVTARQLRSIFDTIPGTKVLILDACHSGAVIGKGMYAPFANVFAGAEYKVICSSGGAEESWFWRSDAEDAVGVGAGYFSSALVSALSVKGGYGADDNRDGVITLTELKRYLLANHGASTVRCYPEEDDFAVLRYDASSYTGRKRESVMESVQFDGDILTHADPSVSFSFNMVKPAQVAYQVIYQQEGRWNFDESQLIYDNAERYGAYGDTPGYLSPGMKQRTLDLSLSEAGSYGYMLLQIVARSGSVTELISSRVLCVPPESGDPEIALVIGDSFCPDAGEELSFVVQHAYPCQLTITVVDEAGKTVRRLASRASSRPEQLQPRGSSYCWSGQRNNGDMAEAGVYRIRVKAYLGDAEYEIESKPFEVVRGDG